MRSDSLETTVDLLAKLRAGVQGAETRLVERCLPPLKRWAKGRLPRFARSLYDTQDLVHDAIVKTLPRLQSFDPRGRGALLGFLMRAVNNKVIDEVRKARKRPESDTPLDTQPDSAPSPLQWAILRQGMSRYRTALATLSASDQDIIRARFEDGRSYEEIAHMTEKPNANATRAAANRAIARLLKAMTR